MPVIRLWQGVAMQAIQDASHGSWEARHFIAGPSFDAICQMTDLSAPLIREQIDDPDLWKRFVRALGGRRTA